MEKRRSLAELVEERQKWQQEGKKVVWTNGCFDLFHAGHVRALETAKQQGDILIVGLNSDQSVRGLKEAGRPLCSEDDRAAVLSSLDSVDRIVVFDSRRCDQELRALKPDIWTKSGDYTEESLDPGERQAVAEYGGSIVITPLVPGISTTTLVKKIRRFDPEKVVSASCAFIRDPAGRLLMVATRYNDGIKWSLPGGGHHHGEPLSVTAFRETWEEAGIEVDILRYMGVIERIESMLQIHVVLHMFEASPVNKAVFDQEHFTPAAGGDIEDVAWFDRERLLSEKLPVLGRRLWLENSHQPQVWPSYIRMLEGEE